MIDAIAVILRPKVQDVCCLAGNHGFGARARTSRNSFYVALVDRRDPAAPWLTVRVATHRQWWACHGGRAPDIDFDYGCHEGADGERLDFQVFLCARRGEPISARLEGLLRRRAQQAAA